MQTVSLRPSDGLSFISFSPGFNRVIRKTKSHLTVFNGLLSPQKIKTVETVGYSIELLIHPVETG
jgi:hypothetical protein